MIDVTAPRSECLHFRAQKTIARAETLEKMTSGREIVINGRSWLIRGSESLRDIRFFA